MVLDLDLDLLTDRLEDLDLGEEQEDDLLRDKLLDPDLKLELDRFLDLDRLLDLDEFPDSVLDLAVMGLLDLDLY